MINSINIEANLARFHELAGTAQDGMIYSIKAWPEIAPDFNIS